MFGSFEPCNHTKPKAPTTPAPLKALKDHLPLLEHLVQLSGLLRQRRLAAGSIDLDLPMPAIDSLGDLQVPAPDAAQQGWLVELPVEDPVAILREVVLLAERCLGQHLAALELPARPERHLLRRPVAPPPLQRPVTLGELIQQLEEIAERLEQEEGRQRNRTRSKRFSDRDAIEQVAALAHREKLPETTAALSQFLLQWPSSLSWVGFDGLVEAWAAVAPADLDCDRVGVFWALLFLCSQGKVELEQSGGLYAPLQLKRLLEGGESVQLPLVPSASPGAYGPNRAPSQAKNQAKKPGPAATPARTALAA
jgi:chromatin segregation and condensation protein Rec8/ScpA/Scc1 (kleisin family)